MPYRCPDCNILMNNVEAEASAYFCVDCSTCLVEDADIFPYEPDDFDELLPLGNLNLGTNSGERSPHTRPQRQFFTQPFANQHPGTIQQPSPSQFPSYTSQNEFPNARSTVVPPPPPQQQQQISQNYQSNTPLPLTSEVLTNSNLYPPSPSTYSQTPNQNIPQRRTPPPPQMPGPPNQNAHYQSTPPSPPPTASQVRVQQQRRQRRRTPDLPGRHSRVTPPPPPQFYNPNEKHDHYRCRNKNCKACIKGSIYFGKPNKYDDSSLPIRKCKSCPNNLHPLPPDFRPPIDVPPNKLIKLSEGVYLRRSGRKRGRDRLQDKDTDVRNTKKRMQKQQQSMPYGPQHASKPPAPSTQQTSNSSRRPNRQPTPPGREQASQEQQLQQQRHRYPRRNNRGDTHHPHQHTPPAAFF